MRPVQNSAAQVTGTLWPNQFSVDCIQFHSANGISTTINTLWSVPLLCPKNVYVTHVTYPQCLNNVILVNWSHYRPGVAQRVDRGIALLFHDRGTRRGWVVSSTPIVQEAGWALGPVWTGGKSRTHRDSTPDHPARSQSLYRLSYPAHKQCDISLDEIWQHTHTHTPDFMMQSEGFIFT